jgi:hypothetical protein
MRYAMLALEFFLFGYGVLMLIRGVVAFSPRETATGGKARLAGAILLLPLLIGAVAALIDNRPWGPSAPEAELGTPATVVEMLSILVCGAVSILIVLNANAVRNRVR